MTLSIALKMPMVQGPRATLPPSIQGTFSWQNEREKCQIQQIFIFWMKCLGVIVLLATAMQQHYRPDLKAQIAHNKPTFLGALIMLAENEMVKPDVDWHALSARLSDALTRVDTDEAWEIKEAKQPETRGAKGKKPGAK
jgi:hypothetical protein